MPSVSVILPTHNRAHLLGRAIQSVLAQTFSDLELIVVDDASTDDTAEVVRRFADPRVRYIRLPQNGGAAVARNVGIRKARAELIAFQDDDDIWLIRKLERQVAELRNAGDDVGLCLCTHIRLEQGGALIKGTGDRSFDFSRGPRSSFAVIITPAWLVRRHALEHVGGFDERMRSWDDWELAARLAKVCAFTLVNEPLLIQDRIQGGQMWRNTAAFAGDMKVILEKHADLWKGKPKMLARQYYTLGHTEARYFSARSGRRELLAAIRLDPLFFRAWVAFAATLAGDRGFRLAARLRDALRPVHERPIGVNLP